MKTVLIVLAIAGLCFGAVVLATAVDTAAKTETIKGKIASVDTVAKQIVVEKKDGTRRTLNVSADVLARVYVGQKVTVSVPVGSDTATKVKRTRTPKGRNRRNQ
jgi:hypothetical protein